MTQSADSIGKCCLSAATGGAQSGKASRSVSPPKGPDLRDRYRSRLRRDPDGGRTSSRRPRLRRWPWSVPRESSASTQAARSVAERMYSPLQYSAPFTSRELELSIFSSTEHL